MALFQKIKQMQFIANYKRMWPFVRPIWGRALISILITIPIGALDAVIALALKPYMDNVVMENASSSQAVTGLYGFPLWVIPVFVVLFTVVQSLLEYGSAYLNAWVGGKITVGVKKKLYTKLLKMESGFMDKHSSGQIVFQFDSDPNTACSGLLNNLKLFTTRLFSSISLICVLFYTSWQLAIVAILVLIFALFPLTRIRKKIKEVIASSVLAGGAALTALNETYAGAKTIASYNLEKYQENKFFFILKNLFRLTIKQTQKTAWLSPMMHIVISFGIAGTIWLGSYLIASKEMTSGDFVSFMVALLMLYTPIKNIGKNFSAVQLSFMAIERIFALLERPIPITSLKDSKKLPSLTSEIFFDNVSFKYKDAWVLHHINLKIKKGQTIALVGNSGGGKTTLVNLLPRFYDVQEGAITIDGINIKEVDLFSLREQIAVVFQDNFLFSGSIRDNILLGKENATEEEIQSALCSACLGDFVSTLPMGLDTQIGERGVLLSGGQKQRIAIARAFLKNAPIVILDEATSALDNKSEAIVQKAIDNLMNDRTVFVIAHRLSTVQNADSIVVLNEGKIVEQGTHEELLKQNGAYTALYMAQFKHKNTQPEG